MPDGFICLDAAKNAEDVAGRNFQAAITQVKNEYQDKDKQKDSHPYQKESGFDFPHGVRSDVYLIGWHIHGC